MVAGDLIRLAWEAEHDGRDRLRDALLTLAVIESGPGDLWADRCRDRLVRLRPDHFLAHFATVDQALEDARVLDARERLRLKYPPSRVQSLLLRARASRGPYLGRVESLDAMIEDLAGLPAAEAENVRLDAAQASRGPWNRHRVGRPLAWSLAYPTMASGLEGPPATARQRSFPAFGEAVHEPPTEDIATYYLTVLLAIAMLLATVQERPSAEAGGR